MKARFRKVESVWWRRMENKHVFKITWLRCWNGQVTVQAYDTLMIHLYQWKKEQRPIHHDSRQWYIFYYMREIRFFMFILKPKFPPCVCTTVDFDADILILSTPPPPSTEKNYTVLSGHGKQWINPPPHSLILAIKLMYVVYCLLLSYQNIVN